MLTLPKVQAAVVVFGSFAALIIACGTERNSQFTDPNADAGSSSGGFVPDGSFGSSSGELPDADLYANDPPPKWCGPPGGDPAPPQPGGTLDCPDDKNKPGCGCTTAGEKAACWTGLRKHRNLGVCKDGQTTCVQKNENSLVWGPCEGEVLPTPGATKGKAACSCFSAGQWKIANTSPCTVTDDQDAPTQAVSISTIQDGNGAKCPDLSGSGFPTTAPSQDWSTDTLNVDCAGHFKLCLRIRQGIFETPSPNDCILGEVCAEDDYETPNVDQPWPNLPGWIGKDTACALKWAKVPESQSAGYAEMIVKGQSVRCDAIDDGNGGDLVFNRVKYCPLSCNTTPNTDDCKSCQVSGAGQF
jgi:hypothetical protein